MDNPTPLITKIEVPSYKKIVIEASDGKRYESNLSRFETVYCFPKNLEEWKKVSIDNYGLALVWASRFEVHVDQVIAYAEKVVSSSEQSA